MPCAWHKVFSPMCQDPTHHRCQPASLRNNTKSSSATDWYGNEPWGFLPFRLSFREPASSQNPNTTSSPLHPALYRTARINIWPFDADSSRTTMLGIIGIVVTLIQFAVSIVGWKPFRSSTQLLVAALEHVSRDGISGTGKSEEGTARVGVGRRGGGMLRRWGGCGF